MNPADRGGTIIVSAGLLEMGDASSIVLVNYNGRDDTLKCLDSLRDQTAGRCLVVVVDNGSAVDESADIASMHPWAAVIRSEVNGGWAGGNNEGIRHALERGAARVILLNNDTVVAPDFLGRLLAAAGDGRAFGVLGPVICSMEEPSEVMTDGCDFNGPGASGFFHRHLVPLAGDGPARVTEVDIVNGCCMMIEAEVFRRIGLIDERFFLIHEESDFCLRARRAGYRCGVLNDALVWHKGSSSFKRVGSRVQRYYDSRNLYLLLRKHPGKPAEGRRGASSTWVEYARYIYHRYCIEREHGQIEAADAVLEGLCDALAGRFGGRRPGTRLAAPALRWAFELARKNYSRAAV